MGITVLELRELSLHAVLVAFVVHSPANVLRAFSMKRALTLSIAFSASIEIVTLSFVLLRCYITFVGLYLLQHS